MKINLLAITAKMLALTTAATVHHHNYNRGSLRPQIVVINHHFHSAGGSDLSGRVALSRESSKLGGSSALGGSSSLGGSRPLGGASLSGGAGATNTTSTAGASGSSVPNASGASSGSGASSTPNTSTHNTSAHNTSTHNTSTHNTSTPNSLSTPNAHTAPSTLNSPNTPNAPQTPNAPTASSTLNAPQTPNAQFKENVANSNTNQNHKFAGSVFGASVASPSSSPSTSAASTSGSGNNATKPHIPPPPGPAPILSKPNKAPKPCVPVPSSDQSQKSPANAVAAANSPQSATKSTVPAPPGPAPDLSKWKPKKEKKSTVPAPPGPAPILSKWKPKKATTNSVPAATNSTAPILKKTQDCKPINVSGTVPASTAPTAAPSTTPSAAPASVPITPTAAPAPGSTAVHNSTPSSTAAPAATPSNTAAKDDISHLVGDYVSTADMLKILQTPGAPLPWKWHEQCYNNRVSHCGPVFKTAARDIELYAAEIDANLSAPTTVFPNPADLRFRTLTAAGAVLGGKLPAFKNETIPYHTYAAMELLIGIGLKPVVSGNSSAQKKVVNVAPFLASRGQLKTHLSPIVRLGLYRLTAALLSLSNTKFTNVDDELRALLVDAQNQPFTLAVLLKHIEGEQLRRTLSKEHRTPPFLQAGIYRALTINVPDTLNVCHPNAQLPAISVNAHFLKTYGNKLSKKNQIMLARAFLYLVFGVPLDRTYCKSFKNIKALPDLTVKLIVNGMLTSYCVPRSKYYVVVN